MSRRTERVVPAPFRPGRLAGPDRGPPSGGIVHRPGHGPAHRGPPPLRHHRPLQPGRRHHRGSPDRPGHPPAPGPAAAPGRHTRRLRPHRVRCRDPLPVRRHGAPTSARPGRPLPGIEVRIVDGDGGEAPHRAGRRDHRARVRAPPASTTRRQRRTRQTWRDGWLFSGDLGYLDERRLPLDHRAHQGPDHPGRQQHRSGRGRRSCSSPIRTWSTRSWPAFPTMSSVRMWKPGSCCRTAPTRPSPNCASSCSSAWPTTRCPGRSTLFPRCPATRPARS